jgi:hypothetical protein
MIFLGTMNHWPSWIYTLTAQPVQWNIWQEGRHVQVYLMDCFLQSFKKNSSILTNHLYCRWDFNLVFFWDFCIFWLSSSLGIRIPEAARHKLNHSKTPGVFGICSNICKLLAFAGATARERFVGSDRIPDASQAQAEPFQDTGPAQLRYT